MSPEQEQKILKEAQDRLKKCIDEDEENRRLALEDLEFLAVDGKQWPAEVKAERTAFGRPCITINKMPVFVDQVVGDQRMNRPSIKVIPVDSKADIKTAKVLSGWVKHVQIISTSDTAVDHAFEHAVACGYGALRVVTKYISDDSFDQEAYIEKIDNALAVYWGKHSKYDCSDAQYCFIISDMDRDEFKDKYGEDPVPFNSADSQYVEGWSDKDTVRVAEYFVKEPVRKTLYQLVDGSAVTETLPGDEVVNKRVVEGYNIMWYLLSGNKILQYRKWVGKKYIPVIPVWGKEYNVGGKRVIRGLIRNAKDPQRMYNYWNSCDTETIALQPRNPYLLTPEQIAGHEVQWDDSIRRNYLYLLVNPDTKAPGWPHREAPAQLSTAMVEKLKESDQEMRDTIGLQKASLGMQSNERSGAAIIERKKEGDVGTFSFIDNLSRSLEHVGRILVDIAPGILDTERVVRLGLDDGSFEFTTVNVESGGQTFNDPSIGTYDVVVTVGPSFSTQRTEAMNSMKEFLQYYPPAAPVIGDLYAKSMDWPGADEVAKRLEFLLPPEIKQKMAEEAALKAGEKATPPAGPPAPPPEEALRMQQEQLKVKEEQLKLQEMEIKLEQERVKLEGLKLKNAIMVNQAHSQKETASESESGEGGSPEEAEVAEEEPIPSRADGGDVEGGKSYIVGENGPELFTPSASGLISPSVVEDISSENPELSGAVGGIGVGQLGKLSDMEALGTLGALLK